MPAARQRCRVAERRQRVAQRLAPLAERGGDDPREQRRVGDRAASRRRAERGARPPNRPWAPGGTRPAARRTAASPRMRLQHHREPAVVGRRRARRHPRDDFLLQHHVQVDELRCESREVEQQRRADVVRQVADDAQPRPECREVELERVGDVQRRVASGGKSRGEPRGEIAVDLDRVRCARRARSAGRSARRARGRSRPGCRRGAARSRRRSARRNARSTRKFWPKRLRARVHRRMRPQRVRRAARAGELDREIDRGEQAAGIGGRAPSRRRRRDRAPCRGRPTCG